ncbi:hypothetical protein [Flavobacterium flavipallidum]|uniref:Uncharacterized protein n=1 Tax=Flavobacterium flavipallidum TaxID=3139140 RepID=A0ABU9HQ84_9FLAO
MKKKHYILVLTFLCILCGQASYAFTDGEGYFEDWGNSGFDQTTIDFLQAFEDLGGNIETFYDLNIYIDTVNNDENPYNDIVVTTYIDENLEGTIVTDWQSGISGLYESTTHIDFVYTNGYDANGYDANGFDVNGYDAFGFNADGYDRNGYDVFGYNDYGFNENGYDIYGYDQNGYDQNGNYSAPTSDLPESDPNASAAGGVSIADAKQLQNDIFNVLNKSPKFDKFKALIKRGPKNNKKFFSKIPQDKLDEALNDLDPGDQKVFATIVANTINSDKPMIIKYFDDETTLKTTLGAVSSDYDKIVNAFVLPPRLEEVLVKSGDGLTSTELLEFWKSGATMNYNGETLSVLDTSSSLYNEAIGLHEFFGHGRPSLMATATNEHNQDDAILFENLVWRLLGKPEKQRSGIDHGPKPRKIIPNYTTALPSFR